MFDLFAFGSTPRLPEMVRDICPLDTICSPPKTSLLPTLSKHPLPASTPLTDLLSQNLQLTEDEPSISQPSSSSSPTGEEDDEGEDSLEVDEDEENLAIGKCKFETKSATKSIPDECRRWQRQLNTQLLCSSEHIRSIDTLVDEMVSTGTQCNAEPSPTSLPVTSATSSSPAENSVPHTSISETSIPAITVSATSVPGPSQSENPSEATPTPTIVPAVPLEVAPPPDSTSAEELIVDIDEGFHEPSGEEAQEMDLERNILQQEAEKLLALRKRQRQGYTANRPRIRKRIRTRHRE